MKIVNKSRIKKKRLVICFFLAITFLALMLVCIFALFNSGKSERPSIDLDSKMTELVTSFYDKNIKGKVFGVDRQIVTLKNLQDQKYDISDFINSECSLDSFSYVILEDPKEKDVAKIKYVVEHHLNCK